LHQTLAATVEGRYVFCMRNTLTYKGYSAHVEFDPDDNLFFGRVLGVRDVITFHGETVAELHADFEAAIDHYLAICAKTGVSPEKPASGRLMLRVPREVHGAALVAAEVAGKSLNQWATDVLKHAARVG